MRLDIRSETFTPSEDQRWLGSAHGTNTGDPITLDGDIGFLALFPTGVIPSGVMLGKITATGLYVPYTDAGTHGVGSDVAQGHLLTTIDLGGTTTATVGPTGAALFWHGEVIEARLPTGHGVTTAGKADLPQIKYI